LYLCFCLALVVNETTTPSNNLSNNKFTSYRTPKELTAKLLSDIIQTTTYSIRISGKLQSSRFDDEATKLAATISSIETADDDNDEQFNNNNRNHNDTINPKIIEEALSLLSTLSESQIQNHPRFNEVLYDQCKFFDGHAKASFPMLRTNLANKHFYKGKPDAVHRNLPIIIEHKGYDSEEFNGLKQAIERILVFSEHFGIYKYAYAFGCGRKAESWWCVKLENYCPDNIAKDNVQSSRKMIDIWKYSVKKTSQLISQLIASDPNNFLIPEGKFIVKLLLQFNIAWNKTKIERISASSSQVFQISSTEENSNDEAFVLKVNNDKTRFECEVNSLQRLANTPSAQLPFPYYGYSTSTGIVAEQVKWFNDNQQIAFNKYICSPSMNKGNSINNKKKSKGTSNKRVRGTTTLEAKEEEEEENEIILDNHTTNTSSNKRKKATMKKQQMNTQQQEVPMTTATTNTTSTATTTTGSNNNNTKNKVHMMATRSSKKFLDATAQRSESSMEEEVILATVKVNNCSTEDEEEPSLNDLKNDNDLVIAPFIRSLVQALSSKTSSSLQQQQQQQDHFVGILIMDKGESVPSVVHLSDQKKEQLYHNIIDNLSFIHDHCGILHCDIRLPNILYFPRLSRYILIDYDLSHVIPLQQPAIMGEEEEEADNDNNNKIRNEEEDHNSCNVVIQRSSGQAHYCPYTIQQQFSHTRNRMKTEMSIRWKPSDDKMMFVEYLLKKCHFLPPSVTTT